MLFMEPRNTNKITRNLIEENLDRLKWMVENDLFDMKGSCWKYNRKLRFDGMIDFLYPNIGRSKRSKLFGIKSLREYERLCSPTSFYKNWDYENWAYDKFTKEMALDVIENIRKTGKPEWKKICKKYLG